MNASYLSLILARLAEPLAASLGLSLWGVEAACGGRGTAPVHRVYVDGADGVDVERCAELSRLLGLALDVEDCMAGPYTLEVSSPGLERRFFTAEQLAGAAGARVEVSFWAPPAPGSERRNFQGRMISAGEGRFVLALEEEEGTLLSFSFEQVRKIRQRFLVPEKTKPGKAGGGNKNRPRRDAAPAQAIPSAPRPA
ncbi:MAG: ribosome maturation factor RimP [Desulfovibrio sp.]|jgi:ribosome maturation factor RimP|nr:ribosome maturation factor RimP [Desulfovibrio sp.]